MFQRFWERYKQLDPTHPTFSHFAENEHGFIIPYMVHGDEGRGKAKSAVLITSYQPLIGQAGETWTNMKGFLGHKRLHIRS